MPVWTISAQEGTGGARVAAELAVAAHVPLFDLESLSPLAHDLEPELPELGELRERFGRFAMLSLSTAVAVGSAEACQEVELRQRLPELGRAMFRRAARSSCVIYTPAAFAALEDHPAIHVRLHAPLACRIGSYQREQLVDRRCAEKAVKRSDHRTHAWLKSLYHVDIDDARRYSVVVDTSCFSPDRIVELLLAAGGVQATAVAA